MVSLSSRKYHRGQALVEFALTATILITLLLGIVDFGRAYYTQVAIKNAIAEAGYYAMQHPGDDAGIRNVIKQELNNILPDIQDSNIPTPIRTGCKITIRVTYSYKLLFTFVMPAQRVELGNTTVVPQIGNNISC